MPLFLGKCFPCLELNSFASTPAWFASVGLRPDQFCCEFVHSCSPGGAERTAKHSVATLHFVRPKIWGSRVFLFSPLHVRGGSWGFNFVVIQFFVIFATGSRKNV